METSTSSTRVPQGVSPKIASRIGQLLRLSLSATIPGEAFAALAAIKRTIDLHVLADAVEIGLKTPTPPAVDDADWQRLARACRDRGDLLSQKEARFVTVILTYRKRPSERQLKWLADIAARVGGADTH
jgi:hypothetical protein